MTILGSECVYFLYSGGNQARGVLQLKNKYALHALFNLNILLYK